MKEFIRVRQSIILDELDKRFGPVRFYKKILELLNYDYDLTEFFLKNELGFKKYQITRIKYEIVYNKKRYELKKQNTNHALS